MSEKRDACGLTRKERHFLELLASAPGATIAQGTKAGAALAKRQLVHVAKYGRWGITPAGLGVLAGHGDMPRAVPRKTERTSKPKRPPSPDGQMRLF